MKDHYREERKLAAHRTMAERYPRWTLYGRPALPWLIGAGIVIGVALVVRSAVGSVDVDVPGFYMPDAALAVKAALVIFGGWLVFLFVRWWWL